MSTKTSAKLAAITAMAAAMSAPMDAQSSGRAYGPRPVFRAFGPPNPSGLLSGGKYMPGHIPKGCKKFIFDENGKTMNEVRVGITAFICIAYNEKSAIKKFQKWQKNKVIQ